MKLPRLTGWMLRLSLVYLLVGFTLGSLILIRKAVSIYPAVWRFLPLHREFLLIGWTLQLVLAVAYWIFPRYSLPPRRGNPIPGWIAFGMVNVGVSLFVLSFLIDLPLDLRLPGRLLELSGVILLGLSLIRRLRPYEGES
jgi:heme/copper-type cytochrome/quinol oxidase subunit 1